MTHAVVIVEDEPPARAKLKRFLAEAPDFRVVAEAANVEDGVSAVTQTAPDVLYLDIQLGVRSGFDVIDGLRGVASPLIVFTTAYSEYAVRAFEVQALDYLLKPFDRERFSRSLERVRAALAEGPARRDETDPGPQRRARAVRPGRGHRKDRSGGELRRGAHARQDASAARISVELRLATRRDRIPARASLACRARRVHRGAAPDVSRRLRAGAERWPDIEPEPEVQAALAGSDPGSVVTVTRLAVSWLKTIAFQGEAT
jgi:two-component system LytT family response regulator